MTFTDYAATKGLVLLRDDLNFIRGRLQNTQKEQRIAILRRYVDCWCETMTLCENAVKRQNEGRKAANIFIREIT